jgi:hypothetical protein
MIRWQCSNEYPSPESEPVRLSVLFLYVPEVGLEPTRGCPHLIESR